MIFGVFNLSEFLTILNTLAVVGGFVTFGLGFLRKKYRREDKIESLITTRNGKTLGQQVDNLVDQVSQMQEDIVDIRTTSKNNSNRIEYLAGRMDQAFYSNK